MLNIATTFVDATALHFGRGYHSAVQCLLFWMMLLAPEMKPDSIMCRHRDIGVHNCNHLEDAGVWCGKLYIFYITAA